MSFDRFNMDPRCLAVLEHQGITQPTPIQERAIPVALSGRDVLAIAQTGTGKTLGFSIPSLTRLAANPPKRNSMLVITPTRELAHQVNEVLNPLGRALGLRTLCVYGGIDIRRQTRQIKQGAEIIVATPGRLLDHIRSRTLRFDELSVLVLDEADQMLDMGFLPDIRRILSALPGQRQTLMFSATFPNKIARLATDMQTDPERIEVGRVSTPTESVRQGVYRVDPGKKLALLSNILSDPNVETALVFIRTKRRTERVARALHKAGFRAEAIHGDRSQGQRQRALDGFRNGRFNILVATDVAARGIDVRGITHVVNFDLPATSEDYVHRIGRTARANTKGDAITFVAPDEERELGSIERAIGKKLIRESWDGTVPERPAARVQTDRKRRSGGPVESSFGHPENTGGRNPKRRDRYSRGSQGGKNPSQRPRKNGSTRFASQEEETAHTGNGSPRRASAGRGRRRAGSNRNVNRSQRAA